LFFIYINDIFNIPNLPSIPRLFADDTNVFVSGKNYNELTKLGNQLIIKIHNWMSANKLSLNHDKTCYIIFNNSSSSPNTLQLCLNGIKLNEVATIKFLGVTVDQNLNWKNHIQDLHSLITKYCGIFYKIRSKIPLKILKNVYFATIYPKLLYGIELYANTYPTYLVDLITVNNKVLRILQNKLISASTIELYKDFNTLPVDKLFQHQLLILAHQLSYYKNSLPLVFSSYFILNSSIHSHNTRNKTDVHINRFNTSFGSRCLDNRCAISWNSLPESIKNITSPNQFQRSIKKLPH